MRTTRWLAGLLWLSTAGCTSVLGDDYAFDLDEGAGGGAGSGASGSSGQAGDAGAAGEGGEAGSSGSSGQAGAGGSPFECGNSIREGAEECDGGDVNGLTCTTALGMLSSGTLGCLPDCKRDYSNCHYCGDGTRGTGEECDGADLGEASCASATGNTNAQGSIECTALCTIDVSACSFCGDGKLQEGEACDGTNLDGASCSSAVGVVATGTLGCTSTCAFDKTNCQFCGDSKKNGTEACEGKDLGGETCESVVGAGSTGTLACTSACGFDTSGCTPPTSCGNGTKDGTDQCDKTDFGGATCATALQRPDAMGKLTCTTNCTFDTSACTSCGDGAINNSEQCDGVKLGGKTCAVVNPAATGTLTCASDCTLNVSGCSYCGDGKKNGNDQCDGADLGGATCGSVVPGSTGTLGCSPTCAFDKANCLFCGDSKKNGSEVCDGSDFGGATCASLVGFGSTGTLKCAPGCGSINTSGCSAVVTCGDGVVDPSKGEQCDGSVPAGATCATETGQADATGTLSCSSNCRLDRSKCNFCGNNIRDLKGEACDGSDLGGAACPPGYSGSPKCSSTCQVDTSSCLCQSPRQDCAGSCLDLSSDPTNCGACGHSCLGAACAKGVCAASPITTGCTPSAFVVDAAQGAIFVVGTSGAGACLVRVSTSGATTPVVLSQDAALLNARLMVADANNLYVAIKGVGVNSNSQLLSIPRAGGAVTALDSFAKRTPTGLCLSGASVFLTSSGALSNKPGNHHTVMLYPVKDFSASSALLDLTGEGSLLRGAACTGDNFYFGLNTGTFPIETVTVNGKQSDLGPTNQRELSQIVLFNGSLYWTLLNTAGPGTIATTPAAGGMPTTLLSDANINPSSLAVDGQGIYWADAKASSINYLGLNGTGGRPLGTTSNSPAGLQLDSSYVYYVTQPSTGGAALFRVPR